MNAKEKEEARRAWVDFERSLARVAESAVYVRSLMLSDKRVPLEQLKKLDRALSEARAETRATIGREKGAEKCQTRGAV